MLQHGVGEVVIAEAVYAEDGKPIFNGRLHIWRKELAIFSGVLILAHDDVEDVIHGGDRAGDIHQGSVGVGARDSQAMLIGVGKDFFVVRSSRTELFCELLHGQILAVLRACGIVDSLKKGLELLLIAKRQGDGKAKALRGGKAAQRRSIRRSCEACWKSLSLLSKSGQSEEEHGNDVGECSECQAGERDSTHT